jgi:hypothetical protein
MINQTPWNNIVAKAQGNTPTFPTTFPPTTPLSVVADLNTIKVAGDLIGKVVRVKGPHGREVRVDDIHILPDQIQLQVTVLGRAFESQSWGAHIPNSDYAKIVHRNYETIRREVGSETIRFHGDIFPIDGPLSLISDHDWTNKQTEVNNYFKEYADYQRNNYWRNQVTAAAAKRTDGRKDVARNIGLAVVGLGLAIGGCNHLVERMRQQLAADEEASRARVAESIRKSVSTLGPETAPVGEHLLELLKEYKGKGTLPKE